MSSEVTDMLSGFSSAVDSGSGFGSRYGSVKLRSGSQSSEGRRQIPSRFLESVSSHASLVENASYSSTSSWYDVVEPLDLEQEIEAQVEAVVAKDDAVKILADFPVDDLQMVTKERHIRTVQSAVPADEKDFSTYLKCCIKSFTQDYTVIKRNYSDYGSGKLVHGNKERPLDLNKQLPKQIYEGDETAITEDPANESSNEANEQAKSRGSWASSIINLKNSQADVLLENILDSTPQDEIDQKNAKLRLEGRFPHLFSLFSSQTAGLSANSAQTAGTFEDSEFPVECRFEPPPPMEHFGYRLLVKCLSLELDIDVEPIFASIALYDTKQKKKVSENFYFDLNSENAKKLLKQDGSPCISSLARSAAFSLTHPSHDVFIVIKLEKILQQGDIGECVEPYTKDATEKSREKAKANAKWFCDRLGKYRMPFAWTAIHLMNIVNSATNLRPTEEAAAASPSADDFGKSLTVEPQYRRNTLSRKCSLSETELSMLSSFKPVTLTVSSFFKQEGERLKDEDLYKFLTDLKRPSNVLKRLKCIPGRMKIDVSPCPDNFPYCITSDLHKVKPYPDQRGRPTREIQEFPAVDIYIPNTTYRNLLYVYPFNVNFTNRPSHSRNIAVKVQILESEDPDNALPLIYGKSNGPEYSSEAYTAVSYHNKNPDFYEEIKIQLPTKLTNRHHLFFTFYHISCQKKQDLTPIETPVGYTWLPILQGGRLRIGDAALPVSLERLPPHYSLHSPEASLPGIKWADGHKAIFSVSLQCVSTVHMLDRHLETFFGICHLIEHPPANGIHGVKLPDGTRIDDIEGELRKSMHHLTQDSKLQSLVRFLHVVLDKLVKMLVRPPVISGQTVNMGQNCFEAIARLSYRLHQSQEFATDLHQRNLLLSAYTRHVFAVPSFERSPGDVSDPDAAPIGKGSHFATMTRQERRKRPSVTPATFNISSSNPDLTNMIGADDVMEDYSPQNGEENDRSFVRLSMSRSSLMEQTARHQTDGTGIRSVSHKIFHEEIVLLFVVSSGNVKELALQNAWFLFELTVKSMTQYLHETGLMIATRRHRFPVRFADDLVRLVKMVSTEICNRFNRDYDASERLNCSLAFFINDLLSIMDRGFVSQLLYIYCNQLSDKMSSRLNSSPASLLQFRVTLLRVVCSHEHYVTLNLPFSLPPTPSSPSPSISSTTSSVISNGLLKATTRYDLSERFTRQHYLAGLLLSDIRLSFELAEQGQASLGKVQLYALTTLRNLMASHDADRRIKDNPEVKRAIAALYLPLLSIAMKGLNFVHTFDNQDKTPIYEDGMISSSVASAIASPSPQLTRANTSSNLNTSQMSAESTRNLLVCFLWLLKNTDSSTLRSWWMSLPSTHLLAILDLLYVSISCFEYKSTAFGRAEVARTSLKSGARKKDSKSRLQEAILGESSARRELLMRRRGEKAATIQAGSGKDGLRWRKDQTEWKQFKQDERMKQSLEDSTIGRNFSAETSMIVLDTLEHIIEIATELNDGTSTSQILSCALRVLLHCFSKRQSVAVLQHAFAVQRSMVAKFPELVFEEETEQCADLTLRLLEKCSSNSASVRMNAAASLYMLMRHNFSMGSTFARVKMQITMSMSSLVGVARNFDEEFLRRSLKTVLSYAEIDSELEGTSFPEQVRDLVFNLHMILSDTVKMKEHKEDPEMLIDLMYRIAKGYQNSPDLRLTWLQNMANQHSERKNQAEAGMCLLHCAALVAEYLSMIEYKSYLPIGCVTFEKISGNILEESAVSDDVLSSNADEVCSEKYFSAAGLTAILEQAAQTFTLGGLHEVVDMIYQILIPIYEKSRDYKKLSQIHGKLQDCFNKISSQSTYGGWEVGKRMFGTYFRVGFYGRKFGDLNGEEFIYKEPAITKLPEISLRLESFYKQCFGDESVEMVKDSSTIDRESLDPDKAYIQITFVEPYFYEYENEQRSSYFDRNFNVDKFMYATPFTKNGKAHGEMKEQYKRKTFLQVSNTFPYIKTRINVIKRWETVLSPLESACEDVMKKTTQLLKAVAMNPPDLRMLQVNLQGAVLTAVNQGPMEVANTFLAEIPDEPKLWIHYNQLRLSFKSFDHACSLALKKNKTLISSDQHEYQREMQRNYQRMSERLRAMVGNRRIIRLILEASNEHLGLC